jgi:hypothetical protein
MILNLRIEPAHPKPQSVILPELRVLSLRCMAWNSELELALSMITPGSHPLHMSIHLPECSDTNPRIVTEMRAFFERSNVIILHAAAFSFWTWFASQLGPLPHVQTLALVSCHFSDVAKAGIRESVRRHANPCPISPALVLWPQLRDLYLVSCGLEKDHLYQLLSLHTIQNLSFHRCFDDKNVRAKPL